MNPGIPQHPDANQRTLLGFNEAGAMNPGIPPDGALRADWRDASMRPGL